MKLNIITILAVVLSISFTAKAQDHLKGKLNDTHKSINNHTNSIEGKLKSKSAESTSSAKDIVGTHTANASAKVEALKNTANSKKDELTNKANSLKENALSSKNSALGNVSGLGDQVSVANGIKNIGLAQKIKSSISNLSNAGDKLSIAKSAFETAKASGILSATAIAEKEAKLSKITAKIAQIKALIGASKGL